MEPEANWQNRGHKGRHPLIYSTDADCVQYPDIRVLNPRGYPSRFDWENRLLRGIKLNLVDVDEVIALEAPYLEA